MARDDFTSPRAVRRLRLPCGWKGCLLAGLACASLACAGRGAPGPVFEERWPAAGMAILYVYRVDRVPSRGLGRLRLGSEFKATLANGEFLWLELPAGGHVLSFQFRSFPWAWGWNKVPVQVAAGTTHFLRLSADVQQTRSRPGVLEDRYDGPGSERYGVTLLRGFVFADEALAEIRETRLSPDLVD